MTKQFIFSIVLLLLTLQNNPSFAQSTASAVPVKAVSLNDSGKVSANTIFKKLRQEEVLQITIQTDFNYLIENKIKDDYQDASLTIINAANGNETFDIEVKPRGKFRRMNCAFPPLKVKFDKNDLSERGIATKHKSLKLVTHCLEDEAASQNVIEEYLAYKMYNALTDISFNVQLVQVTYVDTNDETQTIKNFGFLIEDIDELAERVGCKELDNAYNITMEDIKKSYKHLVPMFQYMIANMDWRPQMLQNVKVIENTDGDRFIIPYDFDFSGVVDAPYARPSVDHQQTEIRQRIYLSKVNDLEELDSTIHYFKVHKDDILNVIKSCEMLTKENKKSMVKYIKEFYDTLESPIKSLEAFVIPN
jgi:hypothetical protein